MISNIYLVALSTVGLFCLLAANQANGVYLRKQCTPQFFESLADTWKQMDRSNSQALEEVKLLAEKNLAICQVALYSAGNPMERKYVRDDIREHVLAAKSCSKELFEPMFSIPADRLINGAIDYLESKGKIKLADYKSTSMGASFGDKYSMFTSLLKPNFVDEFPGTARDFETYELAREMAITIELLELHPNESIIEDIIDHKIGNALREFAEKDNELAGETEEQDHEAFDTFADAVYHKLEQRANGNSVDC